MDLMIRMSLSIDVEMRRVLTEIDVKPVIRECCRVGLKKPGSKRPFKVTLSSCDMVNHILRTA